MKTKAVRLYGVNDIRLEEFELPPIKENEILARVISDSICMSSHKAALQGKNHKRVPDDIEKNPIIIGHEFCGILLEVGKKWQQTFKAGQKFTIQPALHYKGSLDAPGYSYRFIGGSATHVVIPNEVMEMGCLLPYSADAFFYGSLTEPMSCVVGAFHASYHTVPGSYIHNMGITEGGNMALLAGAGPMGLGAIDYALHCDRKPGLLVVTDIDDERLKQAGSIYTTREAKENGVDLRYINTKSMTNVKEQLVHLTDGKGYHDVFVFAPVKALVEQGDSLLANDGCLNFFAGPTSCEFFAPLNFYNVHYASTHIVGTSGGNTSDMLESIEMMEKGLINPATMVTHIGGLDAVIDTVLNLPDIPGGKKLIYTNIKLELTALTDLDEIGKNNPLYSELAKIVKCNNGLWSLEAEKHLLENCEKI